MLLRERSRLCRKRAAAAGKAPLVRFGGAMANDRRACTSSTTGSLVRSRLFRRRATPTGALHRSKEYDLRHHVLGNRTCDSETVIIAGKHCT